MFNFFDLFQTARAVSHTPRSCLRSSSSNVRHGSAPQVNRQVHFAFLPEIQYIPARKVNYNSYFLFLTDTSMALSFSAFSQCLGSHKNWSSIWNEIYGHDI